MPPVVSVIIPTYNRAALLPAAIESVFRQTFRDWELIVVDDGSTDGTPEVVRPYLHDDRIRYVTQPNSRQAAARNHGARLARCDWLAFLDSDDRYLPNALAQHHAALRQQPAVSMTIGGYEYINDHGQVLGERRPWNESGLTLVDWLFNCLAMPGSVLIRHDWFGRVQGFDSNIHGADDWDLFLRLVQAGCTMGWTKAIVCQYRQHAGSLMHHLTQHREGSLRVLEKAFRQPGLPDEIAAIAPRAKAWAHVAVARMAIADGHAEAATFDLEQALALDPALAGERRAQLLEILLRPMMMGLPSQLDLAATVAPHLPPTLRSNPADIRRAQARAHMAAFFQARGEGAPGQALAHLRAALRRDARWLFNRGVLAFCVRLAFGRPSRRIGP